MIYKPKTNSQVFTTYKTNYCYQTKDTLPMPNATRSQDSLNYEGLTFMEDKGIVASLPQFSDMKVAMETTLMIL